VGAEEEEEENSLYIESALENVKHLIHVEESRVAGDRGSDKNEEEKQQQLQELSGSEEAAAEFSLLPIVNKELLNALLEQPGSDNNVDNSNRAHNISLLKDAYRSHTSPSLSPEPIVKPPQLTLEHPLLSGSTGRDRIPPVSPDSTNRSGDN
jgi:hypothetical protein